MRSGTWARVLVAVALAAGTVACRDAADHGHADPAAAADVGATAHEHRAPHGGMLVPLGDHFANLELLHDPQRGRLDVWLLGAHASEAIRSAAPRLEVRLAVAGGFRTLTLAPVASPLTGEVAGDTSQFAVTDEALQGVTGLSGAVLGVELRGRVFPEAPFQLP